ncbi:hypothetical protein BH23CHL7_BH23CHL7_24260 [soil metagenome]
MAGSAVSDKVFEQLGAVPSRETLLAALVETFLRKLERPGDATLEDALYSEAAELLVDSGVSDDEADTLILQALVIAAPPADLGRVQ